MAFIIHAVTSYPQSIISQDEIKKFLKKGWPEQAAFIDQFMDSTTVQKRHFTLPLERYQDLGDMGNRNKIWKDEALRLQKENITKIFAETKIDIADIGLIASATTTGLAVPSLEALIMNHFPFSPDTKRLPLFGLGCLAGVAGINRVNDYLVGHPSSAAILMLTELCSLTFQVEDKRVANIIGTSLFGDGSGAVLLVGKDHPMVKHASFEILATGSTFYPNTERLMGWDIVKDGFQINLSSDIPSLVKEHVGRNIDDFLSKNKITRERISYYIAHPGGPKVLEALCETMGFNREKLSLSWESLSNYGNTSATSVINVLEQTIRTTNIALNSLGIMMAMGPAFSLELNLVRKC
ncbi:MAG: 3-oxoacyl-[acyl-carrier-protein] synthase III C-terminal domain-containing protein [Bacteriovorax sp.]|nr:3-oxoacyl-[acyl-carrier-protein] synthase III C-terminal domain-containing protein [Bacteriovorax sp.]